MSNLIERYIADTYPSPPELVSGWDYTSVSGVPLTDEQLQKDFHEVLTLLSHIGAAYANPHPLRRIVEQQMQDWWGNIEDADPPTSPCPHCGRIPESK